MIIGADGKVRILRHSDLIKSEEVECFRGAVVEGGLQGIAQQ